MINDIYEFRNNVNFLTTLVAIMGTSCSEKQINHLYNEIVSTLDELHSYCLEHNVIYKSKKGKE